MNKLQKIILSMTLVCICGAITLLFLMAIISFYGVDESVIVVTNPPATVAAPKYEWHPEPATLTPIPTVTPTATPQR